METITLSDIEEMELLARVQFATSLPGAKPISLIGTIGSEGTTNLAPFSSVVHLGSSPCLLGMVSRPDSVNRHTAANILATGCWTINHLHPQILPAAHQCSARYPQETSEFDAVGLSPLFHDGFAAPFVSESLFRIGLELIEMIPIPANGTQLIIGKVVLVQVPSVYRHDHGGIDLVGLDCLASTALDTYFQLRAPVRMRYAKPGVSPTRI
jgi:flavin reductase (DIM6/NTAB) family NADH-FMN oxidoreductase RutF